MPDGSVVSLLPQLEPILGATFAVNLAYIGLPRFRYREKIRSFVSAKLEEVKVPPSDTIWYKQLTRLANLPEASETNKDSSSMPRENWAKAYTLVFENHLDRLLVCAAASICAVLLFMGTAHQVQNWPDSAAAFAAPYIMYWFYAVLLMMIMPVFFIQLGGRYVVNNAIRFAQENIDNLSKTLLETAQSTKVSIPAKSKTAAARQSKNSQGGT